MQRIKISAIIIAKNEQKKIRECLESLKWVDEIVLIDNGSDDDTSKIAQKFNAKIYLYPKIGYSELRNKGLEKASFGWVLYVDADERVSIPLREEIVAIIQNPNEGYLAYAIPRKNIILGREMKYGGWWPDYVKRLFNKGVISGWSGKLHEEPILKGNLGHLKNSLIHIKEDNLSDMIKKTNIWSDIEAKLMYESNHPKMNLPRFLTAAMREFWLRIIVNKAFLDGTEGMIFGLYQVYSRFISYSKLWELQVQSTKT